MPLYGKIVRAGGVEETVCGDKFDMESALYREVVRAVYGSCLAAGVPFTVEILGRANVTDLGWSGDYRRQLVEVEI